MIYKSQLFKELGLNSVAIVFILLIILFSIQLVNLLGQATRGLMSVSLLFNSLLTTLVNLLPTVLCVSCFITVLKVLNRYWRDNEMIVWLASGLPLRKWIIPVLLFIIPFFLILCFLTLYSLPIINSKSQEYVEAVKSQPSLDFLDSGVFVPIPNGTIFIESFDHKSNHLRSFFSHEVDPETKKFEITIAKAGVIELKNNGVQVTLKNANRYLGYPNQADFSVFTSPKVVYYVQSAVVKNEKDDIENHLRTVSNQYLWKEKTPVAMAELMWRWSQPLSMVLLTLLAIPLSFTNNRSRKDYHIIWAIILFFIYQNSLTLLRHLVARGLLSFSASLLLPLFCLIILIYLAFICVNSPDQRFSLLKAMRHD